MGFMESVGALSVIFIIGYLIMVYASNKEDDERKKGNLIANNSNCQHLISKRNIAVTEGKSVISQQEFKKQLDKIIENTKEEQEALDHINRRANLKNRLELEQRAKRKVGYKYEIEIFEIFDTNRELLIRDLCLAIESRYNITERAAKDLFELWNANWLIQKCTWNPDKYEVVNILKDDYFSLDSNDLTRKKWLREKGKTLKPESQELLKYLDRSI